MKREFIELGFILFLVLLFVVAYLRRDKSKDKEKEQNWTIG